MMAKSASSTSQIELESRLRALTESLIQKQTMLEALSTEKNSLVMQLERMEVSTKGQFNFICEPFHQTSACAPTWAVTWATAPTWAPLSILPGDGAWRLVHTFCECEYFLTNSQQIICTSWNVLNPCQTLTAKLGLWRQNSYRFQQVWTRLPVSTIIK